MRARYNPGLGDRSPVRGNAAAGLSGLLTTLGITDAGTRGGVEDEVVRLLSERDCQVTVSGLQWGTLTLSATPQTAQLVRFEHDTLLESLERTHPGTVQRLVVRVNR